MDGKNVSVRLKTKVEAKDSSFHRPVVVISYRSVGLSVFVFWNVLGQLCAQRQFLPLLLAIVRHPWYLLWLLRAVDGLQLQ